MMSPSVCVYVMEHIQVQEGKEKGDTETYSLAGPGIIQAVFGVFFCGSLVKKILLCLEFLNCYTVL